MNVIPVEIVGWVISLLGICDAQLTNVKDALLWALVLSESPRLPASLAVRLPMPTNILFAHIEASDAGALQGVCHDVRAILKQADALPSIHRKDILLGINTGQPISCKPRVNDAAQGA